MTDPAAVQPSLDDQPKETATSLAKTNGAAIDQLLELAVREKVSVDVLERLEAMHERMMERGARAAFFEALNAFQEQCPVVEKSAETTIRTKSGSTYSYTYAKLEEITKTIRPVLKRHGLSYSWTTEPGERPDFLHVVCVLRHVDGHEERSVFPVPTHTDAAMSGAQKQGAALTYGKRQSLTSVLGLTTSDDVDGAGRAQPVTPDQIKEINDLASEILEADIPFEWNRFLDYLGVEALDDLTTDDLPRALSALKRKKAEGAP